MKKRMFLINAVVLTLTSLLLRTIDIYFRVFISGKIGAEGMGLFQLIFTVFALAVTFATSSLSLAVTRLVAEEAGKGNTTKNILHKAVKLSFLFSVSATVLLFTFADYIGSVLLSDTRTILSLKTLAFCLPFIAISACLSGYFIAKRKAVKSAAVQIFEQFMQIAVLLFIINLYLGKGLELECFAISLGSTLAVIASFILSFILYKFEPREPKKASEKGITRKILNISLPMALSSYLRMGLMAAENILIPIGLVKSGSSKGNALAQFGIIKALVIPILFFPSAFLSAFSMLLVPEISEAAALNEQKKLNYTIERAFQVTILFSILVTGIFMFFSNELAFAIYKNYDTAYFLKTLAPLIPLMYLDSVVDSILKGLNHQVGLLKINVFDSVTRIALIIFLIPSFGVMGLIIVIFVSNILNPFLSILKLIKVSSLKIKYIDWIIKPSICVTLSCIISTFLFKLIGVHFNLIFAICFTILLYVFLIRFTLSISAEDVNWAKTIFKSTHKSNID